MRVIKFRAWDGKAMHQNVNVMNGVASVCEDAPNGVIVTVEIDDRRINAYSDWAKDVSKPQWELMQFTGLTDANGIEIYEGDIIGGGELVAGYVAFKDGAFRLNQGHDNTTDSSLVQWRTGKLKVIGNIHQNPDLLESDDV